MTINIKLKNEGVVPHVFVHRDRMIGAHHCQLRQFLLDDYCTLVWSCEGIPLLDNSQAYPGLPYSSHLTAEG